MTDREKMKNFYLVILICLWLVQNSKIDVSIDESKILEKKSLE